MKKEYLCCIIMAGCFSGGAFCQQNLIAESKANSIIRTTYDSLEMVQRPTWMGNMIPNENNKYIVRVRNQKKFDKLEQIIVSALKTEHKNIHIKIKKGTYYFREGHINLDWVHYPDADIIIEGKGTTIVSKGWEIKDGDEIPCDISGESCFVDVRKVKSISPWGEMMYADSLVEIIDEANKRCRLKCTAFGGVNVPEGNMAYLDLTRWCRCYQYKILKIENGYVYFYAHDLAKDSVFLTQHYNVNYDYVVGKTKPRFRICNSLGNEPICVIGNEVRLKKGLKTIYLGDAANFITMQDTYLRQFIVSNITFLGNKPSKEPLIKLKNVRASNLEFDHCNFIGQRGEILSEVYSKNLYFHDNYVADNYVWGINSNPTSSNTTIENNIFENNGIGLSYDRCVTCSGNNYYIAHNKFKNFGYCAISVGLWYGSEMKVPSNGIIEYNEMWYDMEYFNNSWKHTIMDGGAIYVWTQNERSIIRYNYIHDYTGMSHNRGIYLDDGAHHVSVYGNIILNTPNWYSIDSRRVSNTEKPARNNSFSVSNNVYNYIAYNIIDGSINFIGNEKHPNNCFAGSNIMLNPKEHKIDVSRGYSPEIKNLDFYLNDIKMEYISYDDRGFVCIYNNILSRLPVWNNIKQWVRFEY